jgi:hypothetical protein
MVDDMVFVATSSTQGGTVTVKSGDQTVFTQDVAPGVQMVRVPMGVGEQSFEFSTKAGLQASGKSSVPITDSCWVSGRGRQTAQSMDADCRTASTTTTSIRARSPDRTIRHGPQALARRSRGGKRLLRSLLFS